MLKSRNLGILCGILSAVSFGVMNVIVNESATHLPHSEMAFARGALGFVVLSPFLVSNFKILISRRGWILWARSLAGAVSVVCIFFNLKHAGVGDAAALSNLSALFVVILTWLFLKEKILPWEWAGVCSVILGVLLLQSPFGSALPFLILAVGVTGAFTASLAYLALREAAQKFSPLLIVGLFCGATALLSCFIPDNRWTLPSGLDFLALLCVGLLGVVGQILMTHAYMRLPAAIACALSLSSVIWGVMLESILKWRLPNAGSLLSYGIILAGVFVIQNGEIRPKKKPQSEVILK